MVVVKWFPGMSVDSVVSQVYEVALDHFPTVDVAARSLGISKKTLERFKEKMKAEKLSEEQGMENLISSRNEAILRFKRMAAEACVEQERKAYQQIVKEDEKDAKLSG